MCREPPEARRDADHVGHPRPCDAELDLIHFWGHKMLGVHLIELKR
jgi:hypothetical protein